jgi:hypothetical protein
MITPVNETPASFLKRYNRIVDGDELIDSASKLKEFWLFAIQQGLPQPEVRERIAALAITIPYSNPVRALLDYDYALREAYIALECFKNIGDSPNSQENDRHYHDLLWKEVRECIEIIDEELLDKRIDEVYEKNRLSPLELNKISRNINKLFRSHSKS